MLAYNIHMNQKLAMLNVSLKSVTVYLSLYSQLLCKYFTEEYIPKYMYFLYVCRLLF